MNSRLLPLLPLLLLLLMSVSAVRARNASVNCTGRRAMVVGGTSGIGKGIALRLAKANFGVTVVGRDAERGREVVAAMTERGGSGHEFMPCDASLMSNIRACAAAFSQKYQSLDVLVETQGIASMAGRTETSEGIDQKMAVHFYGRIAFIDALLPLLRKAHSPRVLSVLSAGVHSVYEHWSDDPELKEHFSLKAAADAAGLYNDLALDALARLPENANVAFIHAAPGFVNTNWGTELPWVLRGLVRVIQPLGTSLEDCGEFMSDPLLAAEVPHGRVILIGSRAEPVSQTPVHDKARDAIWTHTQQVLARAAAAAAAAGAAPPKV